MPLKPFDFDGETIPDQTALNRNLRNKSAKKQIKTLTINKDIFPPGCIYFQRRKQMFFTDNPPDKEVIV